MKNSFLQTSETSVITMYNNATCLHKLVNKLQLSLLSRTTARKSFIVNDIDKLVTVSAEENMLAYVIGSLLINLVYSSTCSCIRIETASEDNQLQIRIRNISAFVSGNYIQIPGHFLDAAKKLGGNIGLEAEENKGITVIFSLAKNAA